MRGSGPLVEDDALAWLVFDAVDAGLAAVGAEPSRATDDLRDRMLDGARRDAERYAERLWREVVLRTALMAAPGAVAIRGDGEGFAKTQGDDVRV